ncbi:MAG: hypothetical protein M3Y44_09450 [Actinomycetota bacterium]|nr:hypothetical protein [Actinomycetota bacterium]
MTMRTALWAGAVSAVLSGAPSTAWALASGADPLAPSLAAGSMLLPRATSRPRLLIAATGMHVALSLGWAQALAVLPGSRRRSVVGGVLWGAAAGVGIAALDLGLVHLSGSARFIAVRGLPVLPQVADHLAYGAIVGALLERPGCPSRRATALPGRRRSE